MEYKGLYPKDFYLTNKTLNHLSVLGDKQLYVVILFAWTILRRKTDQIWWHHSFYGWPLNVYCIHNSLHVRFISARQLSTQNRVFILICRWCNQTRFIRCSVVRYSSDGNQKWLYLFHDMIWNKTIILQDSALLMIWYMMCA